MDELLDIFTEYGNKIGSMTKKSYYSQTENVPWIKCCSCFVIDDDNKKILFEKRGKRFLDAGKLDLCSGHVQSGELPSNAMIRELEEELGITEKDFKNFQFLGKIKVDYTTLSDETNRKNLKCIVSIFALKLKDIGAIQIDNSEVIRYGWLSFEDSVGFIENSMTRMPYEENLIPMYSKIFSQLENFINNEKLIEED